ncbi:MAG: hypothetical protein ACW98Y_13165 [Candidatus Thorarchaeota archaeon]|jgi:hypothetical protein
MMKIGALSRIQAAITEVKTAVKRFIVPEIKYDEAARVYRCSKASEHALRDLENIKSGAKTDIYRSSFSR